MMGYFGDVNLLVCQAPDKLADDCLIQLNYNKFRRNMEQDIIIKFCVVGEPSVGKTSMLYQYVHHKFDDHIRATIGCDFSTKLKSSVEGKAVRLQLWDIAGQERFNAVSKMYLRGALGCVIVCSADDPSTIQLTLKWKKIILDNMDFGSDVKIPCLLVQNKSDLIDNQNPQNYQTKKYLEQFSRSNQFCGFLQCSAKQNRNIEEIFQTLLDEAIKRNLVKNYPSTATKPTGTSSSKVSGNIALKNNEVNSSGYKRQKKPCC